MTDINEYLVSEDDLKGGGGGDKAKPRGKYTGRISQAKSKPDKNKKLCLQFGISITHGAFKKQLLFENYLSLDPKANKFSLGRRNSFYKAIDLKTGQMPYGVTDERPASDLDGTYVDIQVEHEYEQVPGEEHSLVTSTWSKSRWVEEGWENGLDEDGNLVRSPGGTEYDAPIKPRETLTWYSMSDEFAGVGDPDFQAEQAKPKTESKRPPAQRPAATRKPAAKPVSKPEPPVEPESADDDDWGV